MIEHLKTGVVIFGAVAILLTAHLGWFFWKHRHANELINGIVYMSWAFTLICMATYVFAISDWLELYLSIPGWGMILLRVIIFGSAIGAYRIMMCKLKILLSSKNG